MDAKQLRYRGEYAVFCTLLFVLRALPVRTSIRLGNFVAWTVHRLLPRKMTRYAIAAQNIRTAFGENLSEERVDQIILGMWQHLARMVIEVVQMERRVRLYNCGEVMRFTGRKKGVAAAVSGRPVLFLGGHFGNWEVSVNTFGDFGFPMGVVARDLDNPWLHQWFKRFRESTGSWIISKSGATTELVAAMEAGKNATLLGDQDAGRRGVFVDFFGKPASTFKSIALLALQHDAIIIVGGAWRLPHEEQFGSRWVEFDLTTEAVIDSRDFQDADAVPKITQAYTSAIESLIRRAPEQYFWVHRRWKTAVGAKRPKRTERAAA